MRPTALRSVPLAAAVVGPALSSESSEEGESGTFAVPAALRARAALPLTSAHVALAGGAHAAKPVPSAADAKDPTQQSLWTEQPAQPRSQAPTDTDRAITLGISRTLHRLQTGEEKARWSNRALAWRAGVDPHKVGQWREGKSLGPLRMMMAMGEDEAVACVREMFRARREGGR